MKSRNFLIALPVLFPLSAAAADPHAAMLRELGQNVSAERLEADIVTLVNFGTRHTLSDTQSDTRGIGAARRWLKAEFESISKECGGCLEVLYVSDFVEGEPRIPDRTEVVNVIAIQRGTRDPGRVVLMSGHYDSRASDPMDATSDAPGANDDGSGTAAVIEAARVLSQEKFPGTIVYAALAGEEQGLHGGKILARYAVDQGWRVKAVLNNDIVGNSRGMDGVIDNSTARVFSEGTRDVETEEEARVRRFSGGEIDSASRNLARYIDRLADRFVANFDMMMVYRLDRFSRGGDHRAFNAVGIPAVRISEAHEHYDRQHQDVRTEDGRQYGDLPEGVDFDYLAKVTAVNVVSLASLASAPPFPANVTIEGAVSPSTTLKWTRPEGKAARNLDGYKIYWRLTDAPQWTNSVYVGDVTEHTLENVVIDNYFFGVASVAENGAESPAVFPGAAGSFGE